MEYAQSILKEWDITLNLGAVASRNIGRSGVPWKSTYVLRTAKASYLKIIIDQCYPYFSEKKQSDCDRILKNLADRGLL